MHRTAWIAAALVLVVAATAWWLLDDGAEVSVDGVGQARRVESDGLAVGDAAATVAGDEDVRELEVASTASTTPATAPAPVLPRPAHHAALTERVTARVIDQDGRPVVGAKFRLETQLDARAEGRDAGVLGVVVERITDDAGKVGIELSVAEAFEVGRISTNEIVTVVKPGFARFVGAVEASEIADLVLGDITLLPSVPLVGRVVDVSGRPIAGARVRVRESNGFGETNASLTMGKNTDHVYIPEAAAEVVTGADGVFTIHDLQPRRANLVVDAEGFAPRVVRSVHIPSYDRSEGPAVCEDIILDPGRTIRGVVLSTSGAVVADAVVLASTRKVRASDWRAWARDELPDDVRLTTTDVDGSYALTGMSPDYLWIEVLARDVGWAESDEVKRDVMTVDFELPPTVERVFTCVDGEAGALVAPEELVAFMFGVPKDPFNADEHAFRLEATRDAAHPSRWIVKCPGGVRPDMRVALDGYLQKGKHSDGDLSLFRSSTLRVRVVDPDGTPIANARVRVSGTSDRRESDTDLGGIATIDAVGVGACDVVVYAPNHKLVEAKCDVAAGGAELKIALERHHRLVVHIRDADGAPVPAACLMPGRFPDVYRWVVEPDPTWLSAQPWKDERFESTNAWVSWVAPGAFEFTALQPGHYRVMYEPGGFVDVEVAGEVTLAEMTLRRWPRVEGRVTATGRPIIGARVEFESPAERSWRTRSWQGHSGTEPPPYMPRSTLTDSDGRWEMTIRPGEQWVVVTTPFTARDEVLEVFSYDEQKFVAYEFDVMPIEGTVVDEVGQPIAGAAVAVGDSLSAFSMRQYAALANGRSIVQEVVSDDQGRFSIVAKASEQNVVVQHPDYQRMESPAVAEPRDDVRVALTRGTRVTVLIQDELGERLFLRRKGWNKFLCRMERVDEEAHVYLRDSREMSEYTSRALPAGRYRVWVERKYIKPRPTLAETFIDITDTSAVSVVLTVPGL